MKSGVFFAAFALLQAVVIAAPLESSRAVVSPEENEVVDIEQIFRGAWAKDKRDDVFEDEDFDVGTAVFSGGAKWVKDKRELVKDQDFDIEQTLQLVWSNKRGEEVKRMVVPFSIATLADKPTRNKRSAIDEDLDFDVEQTLQLVWSNKRGEEVKRMTVPVSIVPLADKPTRNKRSAIEEDLDFDVEQTLQLVWSDKREETLAF